MVDRPTKRLYLLDGMPLLYRGHFIFMRTPRVTASGMNTSAIYGFTNSLLQVLESEQPTHIAVVFDTPEPTFRHKRYPEYKAQREAMPEDIAAAIPLSHDVARALNVACVTCPGYEADDVIGTLACRAEADGFTTWMVTPDKDFAQLVTEHALLYRPGKGSAPPEILGVEEVRQRWQIAEPARMVDILGLAGDSADNIPGIPGIGEKTAVKLLQQFHSLEQVLAGADKLKGKQKEKVEQFAEQARLSRELATICCEAPIAVNWDDLAVREPDRDRARDLFRRLEFTSLGKRLFGGSFSLAGGQAEQAEQGEFDMGAGGDAQPAANADATAESGESGFKTLTDVKHAYHLTDTPAAQSKLAAALAKVDAFCFDTETTGLDVRTTALVGLSFAIRPHEAFYVPVPPDRAVLNVFRDVLENPAIEKTGHNLKFDVGVLDAHGIRVQGALFDTMLAHYVLEPEQRHSMDHLARTFLGYSPIPITDLIGEKGKDQKSIGEVEVARVAEYAAEDADVTLQLRSVLEPRVRAAEAARALAECENPLIRVLVEMEKEGIRVDVEALEAYSSVLGAQMAALEEEIFTAAGTHFNVSSPKQLGEILFDILKIEDKPKKTRTGQYATSEDILTRLAPRHRIVELVLDYRGCQKLKSTYVDALPQVVSPRTGRVHTTYSQAVTATGRIASQNPNLQNIPIRTDRGREIRKAFVPRNEDFVLLAADYSQIELRVMAELSGDEALRQTFRDGLDVHAATAARVNGVDLAAVTPDMRRQAKMVNFGIIYGISVFGLGQRLRVSRDEAASIINAYFGQYPRVKHFMDETIAGARETGYVRTLLGRRRELADINSRNATLRQAAERNAINTPIQGTAADMIKLAMIRIHGALAERKLRTRMLLQVHDELVFDCHRGEEAEVRSLVADCMKTALPMSVPIVVDLGSGENWLEAH